MAASRSQNARWPAQTSSPGLNKRRRTDHSGSTSKMARQIVADKNSVESAKQTCEFAAGNDVVSCYPTKNTVIPQHQWATFVWNSNLPEFTQTDRVNIYLFHGDSQQQILFFPNVVNPKGRAGSVTAQVNDSWWGDRGANWDNANISYPFFWIMSRSDKSLDDGTQQPQATFSAVQTTFADSVLAAMSTSALAASATHPTTASTTGSSLSLRSTSTGGVQSGASSSSNFPHWAIAVIVVLGFLAVATTCILTFFIIRRIRRRNAIESNRNSMGSSSPMMANTGHSAASPLLAAAAIPGRHASTTSHVHGAPSVVSPDGASTISRAGSAGDPGPFSGADAAIMADAFRKALRKPDFADRPVEEGESPENPEVTEEQLINRELADEGKDIRSVGSSRGVKVETMSDAGTHDTAH
ncbi:hypothetical protein MIND_00869200 [Mycena indigotica]|uniref:Uncharacterized protein n=1 Tax=Mycena indigotica TaxID=2126181 RepID=A0A8H6SI49_9AGAR|nr:uncharacterized protein MIND_00869200 [Mycena indigotica]KAF7299205.1 hypothetical protein MIND_00869200 [Mycena indigotica]